MSVKFDWNKKTKQILENSPDKIMFATGRILLDMTLPTIPYGETGNLRKTTMAAGVKKNAKSYVVGSYTKYAKIVYNMGDNTNWTTPGTGNKWFSKMWKLKKNIILSNAIKAGGIK